MLIRFNWSSREAFEGLLADLVIREPMQSSGTIGHPKFTFLGAVADLPY